MTFPAVRLPLRPASRLSVAAAIALHGMEALLGGGVTHHVAGAVDLARTRSAF